MKPEIAGFLQELQASGVSLADLLPKQASINYNPLLDGVAPVQAPKIQAPQIQAPQIQAPQITAPDLSLAPTFAAPQMQRRISPDQVTATATGGAGAGATNAPATGIPSARENWDYAPSATRSAIVDGLMARGMPWHVAEGFAINSIDESGLNPTALGDNGNAYGLFQWGGDRKANLEGFASSAGVHQSNFDTQLDFLMSEVNGPEAAAYKQILATDNPNDAAVAVLNAFERPAEVYRARREAAYRNAVFPQAESEIQMAKPNSNIRAFLDILGGGAGATQGAGAEQRPVPVAGGAVAAAPTNAGLAGFMKRVLGTDATTATNAAAGAAGTLGDFFQSLIGGPAGGAQAPATLGTPAAPMTPRTPVPGPTGGPVPQAPNAAGLKALLTATGNVGAAGNAMLNQQQQAPASPLTATAVATSGAATPEQTAPAGSAAPAVPTARDNADQRRLNWSMLGVGLGQMSQGDRVDLQGVLQQHAQRQEVAQQRVDELIKEQQRIEERNQDRIYSQEDAAAKAAAEREQFKYERTVLQEEEAAKRAVADAAAKQTQTAVADQLEQDGYKELADVIRASDPASGADMAKQYYAATTEEERAAVLESAKHERDLYDQINKEGRAEDATIRTENRATAAGREKLAEERAVTKDAAIKLKEQLTPAQIAANPLLPEIIDGVIATGGASDLAAIHDLLKAPNTGTTVNVGEKEGAKYAYAQLDKYGAARDSARSVLSSTAVIRPALADGVLGTGMLEEIAILPLRQIASELGYGDAESLGAQELLVSLTNAVAPTFHVAGSGATSDADLAGFIKASPSLGKSEYTNNLMLSAIEKKAQTDVAKANAAEAWVDSHDSSIIGFESDWRSKQAAGAAPQDFYMVDGTDATVSATLNAFDNGFVSLGDPVLVATEDGMQAVPLTQEIIDYYRE